MDIDETLNWREIRSKGFNGHIGPIRFATVDAATWQGVLTLDERHINSGGVCHGGVYMTLCDVTMGAASFQAGGSKPCATIDFSAHFIAAAKQGQTLLATARLNRLVSGICFMDCEIWAGGRKCATASGIWKFLSDRGQPAA